MVDLTPGVTVVMIGLIICICAIVLVLLILFLGRRPLIEGGSWWPDEKDDLYRCVGARYESKEEIHRYMMQQREREISESFEGIRTTSILPDFSPPVVVPVERPQVTIAQEDVYLSPTATAAVPTPPPPSVALPTPLPSTAVAVLPFLPPTRADVPTCLPPPPPPAPVEPIYIEEVRRPVEFGWHPEADGNDDDVHRQRQIVSYGWRA